MAKLLLSEGSVHRFTDPITLTSLQQAVGGYIEVVRAGRHIIICDEDGRYKEKPPNAVATALAFASDPARPGTAIVGDVVLLTESEYEENLQ